MSRIHCSACGEQGHNRRNRMCRVSLNQERRFDTPDPTTNNPVNNPVNIRTFFGGNVPVTHAPTPLVNVRANHSLSLLRIVLNGLNVLTETVRQYQQAGQALSGEPLTTFLFSCIAKIDTICKTMSRLLLEYNDIGAIAPQQLFTQLEEQVQIVNGFIQQHGRSTVRILVSFVEQRLVMTLTDLASARAPGSLVKRTFAYLKEISLTLRDKVQDLSIADDSINSSCECPICFDQITSEDAVFTGCNHPYCAPCFKGFATSIKNNTNKPCCSLCRTEITQLSFGKAEICNEISQHFYNL